MADILKECSTHEVGPHLYRNLIELAPKMFVDMSLKSGFIHL